eukprot:CAMPEP_0195604206 /NCGR_PEP_ID=MMETSP0815-20121206/6524_1 /TAXON_ID=97485 /ORGANISM="Prymnesium parvum, Strain Texoma1" /LENGTH=474 /DNA_ID=CAMNT_0040743857 /DNA_START=11 /DNA_END=1438 /DNA_ORIENTATION=+
MSSVALVVAIHAIPTCASVGVAAAHAMRGVALASAHRHAEAVDALELSLAIRPEHAPTHVNLGLVWEQVGLPAAALNSYAEAIRISPRMASAYERFGGLLAQELGQIALAEEALQTSIRLEPTRADGWKGLGKLLHSAGSLDRAGDALKMALALAPSEHSIQHNLATVLRAQGRFDESFELLCDLEARYFFLEDDDCSVDAEVSLALAFSPWRMQPDNTSMHSHENLGEIHELPQGQLLFLVDDSALPAQTPTSWRKTLAQVFVTHIASSAECEWVINMSEAHARARGGWDDRGHHEAHPTVDIVVAESPQLKAWLLDKLKHAIWPAIAGQFCLTPDDLWLEDAFIVKYEETGQPGLAMHVDDSEISFNLLLANPRDFAGGGTFFEAAHSTVRPKQGGMLTHFGLLRHAGTPVSQGTRYILAGFVRARPLAAMWREFQGGGDEVTSQVERSEVTPSGSGPGKASSIGPGHLGPD